MNTCIDVGRVRGRQLARRITSSKEEESYASREALSTVEVKAEEYSSEAARIAVMASALTILHNEVVSCRRCPRLAEYREAVGREKKRAYRDCEYWARPVPGFGDPEAQLLILGLAPGAHGSNRTGRPFTGDRSGDFMYPVLHRVGFASQPTAKHRDDGLRLLDAYITAAVRCAPPDNKPLPEELAACAPFLDRELGELTNLKVVVALGRIGFEAYLNFLKRRGIITSKKGYEFGHAARYIMPNGIVLLASYHPSNQNTATGKLTEKMFREIFEDARKIIGAR